MLFYKNIKLNTHLDLNSKVSIGNEEVSIYSIYTDIKGDRFFRGSSISGKDYQFIVFTDGVISKVHKLN